MRFTVIRTVYVAAGTWLPSETGLAVAEPENVPTVIVEPTVGTSASVTL